MIGIDTNVLIRYIVQDDPGQAKSAETFIEKHCSQENPGFINDVVLCELVWVLKRCYKVSKKKIIVILEQILKTRQFVVNDPKAAYKAIKDYSDTPADFADCMISNINLDSGCEETVTFDSDASKSDGYHLLT